MFKKTFSEFIKNFYKWAGTQQLIYTGINNLVSLLTYKLLQFDKTFMAPERSEVSKWCGGKCGPHIILWISTYRDVKLGIAHSRISMSSGYGRTLILRSARELQELTYSCLRALAKFITSESLKVAVKTQTSHSCTAEQMWLLSEGAILHFIFVGLLNARCNNLVGQWLCCCNTTHIKRSKHLNICWAFFSWRTALLQLLASIYQENGIKENC